MDSLVESSQSETFDPTYRGLVTNRLLSTSLPLSYDTYTQLLATSGIKDHNSLGELDLLAIKPSELSGRILDVGIGGGRSLEQAIENGIDMYGVELALRARVGSFHPGALSAARELTARQCLTQVIARYPNRVTQADATQRIPFNDNFFETVIACMSLPGYARNKQEATNSILEMIRVANKKVAFTTGYTTIPETGQKVRIGVRENISQFPLFDFLTDLSQYGVSLTWRQASDQAGDKPRNIVSAHLDVSKKDQETLSTYSPLSNKYSIPPDVFN